LIGFTQVYIHNIVNMSVNFYDAKTNALLLSNITSADIGNTYTIPGNPAQVNVVGTIPTAGYYDFSATFTDAANRTTPLSCDPSGTF